MRIKEETKNALEKRKIHPTESFDNIINRLLEDAEPPYLKDKDFLDWLLDSMKREHPELKILHFKACEPGIQFFCEESDIVLIPHGELKMLYHGLFKEGFEIGKGGHTFHRIQLFQTIDGSIR